MEKNRKKKKKQLPLLPPGYYFRWTLGVEQLGPHVFLRSFLPPLPLFPM